MKKGKKKHRSYLRMDFRYPRLLFYTSLTRRKLEMPSGDNPQTRNSIYILRGSIMFKTYI